jgi:CheY-like chemotaxis protein
MDVSMTSQSLLEYRVLIAEDQPIEQKLLVAALGPAGCTAKLAGNGEEALSYLEATDFDLIIMDSQMPVLSGPEAIKVIRRRLDWKRRSPILLLTEDMGAAEQDEALAQADASLTKPLDIARFISAAAGLAWAGRTLRYSSAASRAILNQPGARTEIHAPHWRAPASRLYSLPEGSLPPLCCGLARQSGDKGTLAESKC